MGKNKKTTEHKETKRDKNNLPVFDSDQDLLNAFENKESASSSHEETRKTESDKKEINKHGIDILDADYNGIDSPKEVEEDFATLLEKSFKQKKINLSNKRKKEQLPLKKRLKRYPPVEKTLDLHGFNAIGAQIKAKSFISSCKQLGYFTVRIIVGKGTHSDLGPVLPDVVWDTAKEMKNQGQVLSYNWENKSKSKSGAIIVYLKQSEEYD